MSHKKSLDKILKSSILVSGILCLVIATAFSGIFSLYSNKMEMKKVENQVVDKLTYHLDDVLGSHLLGNKSALLLQLEYLFSDLPIECLFLQIEGENFFIQEKSNCTGSLQSFAMTSGGTNAGTIYYKIALKNNVNVYLFFLVIAIIILCFMSIIGIFFKNLDTHLFSPLRRIYENLDNENKLKEMDLRSLELENFKNEILSNRDTIQKLARKDTYNKLAKQVAHDIRSPLAALDMAIKTTDNIEERTRNLIRAAANRINDIANNLLIKDDHGAAEKISKELIPFSVQSIISEKRMQYRDKQYLSIDFHVDNSAYNSFSYIKGIEFKRILSNILNNAVEAIEEDQGFIHVEIRTEQEKILISILDSGKGIPKVELNNIFKRGYTFGKKEGQGLGLWFAKEVLQSWGGDITITSHINQGTKVEISLPKTVPPATFVPGIFLKPSTQIIVVDDDQSIHNVWAEKFNASGINCRILDFYCPQSFLNWYNSNKGREDLIFLIDYEYIGRQMNGLQIIKALEQYHHSCTYLITSHFEAPQIRSECERLKVGLIAKSLSTIVPLWMDRAPAGDCKSSTYEFHYCQLPIINVGKLGLGIILGGARGGRSRSMAARPSRSLSMLAGEIVLKSQVPLSTSCPDLVTKR